MSIASSVTSRVATLEELREWDLEACVALLQAAFEGWPGQPIDVPAIDHLRWKLAAPGPIPGRAHLLELDGRLVALGIYLTRSYRVQGTTHRVLETGDAAVHPEHQEEGLYRRRRELKEEFVERDYDFTINFSTNERVATYRRNRGRESEAGRPRILVRVNKVWRIPAHVVPPGRRRWIWTLVPAALLTIRAWWQRRRQPPPRDWRITTTEQFDDRVDALFEAAASKFDFVQERDQTLLNWRYADPRAGDYTILLAEEAEALLGYAVVRRAGSAGWVMDLLTLPDRLDVAQSLVAAATEVLEDCEAITCWVTSGHPYEPLIRAQGFLDLGGYTGMMTRSTGADAERFAPLATMNGRVHVMTGDTDWA